MATKPSLVPTWNTGGANNTAPTAPKIVLGWTNGERLASSYLNHRMKLYGEWCQYLSDGAFTGAHTFGSTVGITGAVTCSSTLGVTGAATFSSTGSFASTLTASNGFTLTTGAANLNGATSISLPKRKLVLSAGLGYVYSGSATLTSGEFNGGAAGTVHVPIPLHEGDRINKIVVSLKRGAGSLMFNLKRKQYGTISTVAGSGTLTVSSGTTDTTGTIDNGSGGNIAHTIAANYSYVMEAAIGDVADRVYMITVEYDRP